MNRGVHTAVGVTTAVLLTVKYPSGFDLAGLTIMPSLAIITSAFGSYAADFDQKPMHFTRGKRGIKKVVAKGAMKAVNTVTGGHRGITHTLLFPGVCFALMTYIKITGMRPKAIATSAASLIFGVFLGWILHILFDMLNGKGCPLFWPVIRQNVRFIDLPSEGFVPWLLYLIYAVGLTLLFFGKELIPWFLTLF